MVTTSIAYPATSTGAVAGVETTLNNGNDIIVPEPTKELVSATFYVVPSGLLTVAQALETRYRFTSDDIDLQPKDIVYMSVNSVVGVSNTSCHPVLQSWAFHVPTDGGENITATGTIFDTTTVFSREGIQMIHSTGRTGKKQMFWANPGAQTSTGTTNGALVTGSTYRINNVTDISAAYGYNASQAVISAESTGGEFVLTSSDFNTSLPLSFAQSPQIAGIGAVYGMLNLKQNMVNINIPTRENVAITEAYRMQGVATAAGDWITGVGYHRRNR